VSSRGRIGSSPDAVITISPLVPPSFVDCCFKRRTKPLLPTMVPSLSSRLPSLVRCFRCPPPPTLAASHGRGHQQSVTLTAGASTSPSSSPGPPVVVAMPPAVVTTPTFVCASSSSSSSSCRRFPPPHRSRERRLSPSRDDLPPGDRRPRIGRWRRDVLLALCSTILSNVSIVLGGSISPHVKSVWPNSASHAWSLRTIY